MPRQRPFQPGPSVRELKIETPPPKNRKGIVIARKATAEEMEHMAEIDALGGWHTVQEKEEYFPNEDWPQYLKFARRYFSPEVKRERLRLFIGDRPFNCGPERRLVSEALELAGAWTGHYKRREGEVPDFGGKWYHDGSPNTPYHDYSGEQSAYIPDQPLPHLALLAKSLEEPCPDFTGPEPTEADREYAKSLERILVSMGRQIALTILHGDVPALNRLVEVVKNEALKAEEKHHGTHIGEPVPKEIPWETAVESDARGKHDRANQVLRTLELTFWELVAEHRRLPTKKELRERAESGLDRIRPHPSQEAEQLKRLGFDTLRED